MFGPRAALILVGLAIASCHGAAPPVAPMPAASRQRLLTALLAPGEVQVPCPIAPPPPPVPTAKELRAEQPNLTDDEIEARIAEAEARQDVLVVNGAVIVLCSRSVDPEEHAGSSTPPSSSAP
jgi:hypothetical protein